MKGVFESKTKSIIMKGQISIEMLLLLAAILAIAVWFATNLQHQATDIMSQGVNRSLEKLSELVQNMT